MVSARKTSGIVNASDTDLCAMTVHTNVCRPSGVQYAISSVFSGCVQSLRCQKLMYPPNVACFYLSFEKILL